MDLQELSVHVIYLQGTIKQASYVLDQLAYATLAFRSALYYELATETEFQSIRSS